MASDGVKAYEIITIYRKSRVGLDAIRFPRRQQLVPIRLSDPIVEIGKNWQPYLVDGELFAVHEITPLRILRIDLYSGRARNVEEHDLGFNLFAFYEKYPLFRGGATRSRRAGEIVGFRTDHLQQYRHQPFLWPMQSKGHLNVEFSSFFHAFNRRGYNIIDPTSVIPPRRRPDGGPLLHRAGLGARADRDEPAVALLTGGPRVTGGRFRRSSQVGPPPRNAQASSRSAHVLLPRPAKRDPEPAGAWRPAFDWHCRSPGARSLPPPRT